MVVMERPSFAELHERGHRNLIGFLEIEIDLATTFSGMARKTDSPTHRAKLLENTRKAVATIRHFSDRIADVPTRTKLNKVADKLEKKISGIGPGTQI
jgi:hypothetical protein